MYQTSINKKLVSRTIKPLKNQSKARRVFYLEQLEENFDDLKDFISDKYDVESEEVVPTIIEKIRTSDKEFPKPKNSVKGNLQLEMDYYAFLWEYYVQTTPLPNSKKVNLPNNFSNNYTTKKVNIGRRLQNKSSQTTFLNSDKAILKIADEVTSIRTLLTEGLKQAAKEEEKDRKEKEKQGRSKREKLLELGQKLKKINIFEKAVKPFQDLLEGIKRFLLFTILGKAFNSLMKWFNDPKNARKIKSLKRFIKDWWPALLGALLIFLTPLKGLIGLTFKIIKGITSTIIKIIPKILKGITGLKNIIKKLAVSKTGKALGKFVGPLGKAGLVIGGAVGSAYLANEITNQNEGAKVQTENAAKVQSGDTIPVPGVGNVGNIKPSPYGMIQGVASGGQIEDGYDGVDEDTGISVEGAGPDTQLIVAKPGEVVLTEKDQKDLYDKTGFDVSEHVGRRPVKKVNSRSLKLKDGGDISTLGNLQAAQWGGIVGGLKNRWNKFKSKIPTPIKSAVKGAVKAVMPAPVNAVVNMARPVINAVQQRMASPRPKPKPLGRSASAAKMPGRSASAAQKPTPSPMVYGEKSLEAIARQQGIRGKELAAFLAQMAHESGDFKYRRELGEGKGMGYSGGDRFHGRGYIQVTHDYNYEHYGKKLGVDLLKNPDLAMKPDIAAKIAVEYWKENVRPTVGKDWDNVFLHSKAINYPAATDPSQVNGMQDRLEKYEKYRQAQLEKLKELSKKEGGGLIKHPNMSSFPINIKTGKKAPFAADNRLIDILGKKVAVQPGEHLMPFVIPKDTVQAGGVKPIIHRVNEIIAKTDSNSDAARLIKSNPKEKNIEPITRSSSKGRSNITTLPPIVKGSGSPIMTSGDSMGGTDIMFSAVSSASLGERQRILETYGVMVG